MRARCPRLCLVLTLLMLLPHAAGPVWGQAAVHPVIEGYGATYAVPTALDLVDRTQAHWLVYDAATEMGKPDQVHPALDQVARGANLHALAGIPREKVRLAVAIHGPTAYACLRNAAYRARYGVDNPNLVLLQRLRQAGVVLYFCGQTLAIRKIAPSDLSSDVTVTLSAVTTLSTLQRQGYAYMRL